MKRGITFLFTSVILLSVFFASHDQAVSVSEATTLRTINPITKDEWFNFTTFNKKVEDTFIVDIEVAKVTDLQNWQFSLKWDPALLAAVHAVLLPYEHIVMPPESEPIPPDVSVLGRLVWGWSSPADTFNGSIVLASLEMRVVNASGSCVLSIDPNKIFLLNSAQSRIALTSVNGYYNLVPAPSGDVNSDGRVDMRDVSLAVAAFGSSPNTPR